MLGKISVLTYIIATILHYVNGSMYLFGLSLGFVTTSAGLYMSFHRVDPQLREFREKTYQMERDGYTDEEILAFIDKGQELDESKLQESPIWILIISSIGIITGLVLLVMGIKNFLG